VPPGRSTRCISLTALRSSGMAHSANVHTTVSNEASAKGTASQDRGSQDAVDQRDPALGAQHRVAQRRPGTGLPAGDPAARAAGQARQRRCAVSACPVRCGGVYMLRGLGHPGRSRVHSCRCPHRVRGTAGLRPGLGDRRISVGRAGVAVSGWSCAGRAVPFMPSGPVQRTPRPRSSGLPAGTIRDAECRRSTLITTVKLRPDDLGARPDGPRSVS
jgi:hypothetical protein